MSSGVRTIEGGQGGDPDDPSLDTLIEAVAHRLPEQAPLHAFVHHNTLHTFEHLRFKDAVIEAGEIFDTEPFQKEPEFAGHIASGRIRTEDIEVIVRQELGEDTDVIPGLSRSQFRIQRLQNLFEVPQGQALAFHLLERDGDRKRASGLSNARQKALGSETAIQILWKTMLAHAPKRKNPTCDCVRPRDVLLRLFDVDADETVHPFLIRTAAAFLDQGVSYWTMPAEQQDYLTAIRSLYARRVAPPDRRLRGLRDEFLRQQTQRWDAERTIRWAFEQLDVRVPEQRSFVEQTLLSLRGWAGMMHHLEVRPDRAPVTVPHARLKDYLAVQLTLDVVVAKNLRAEYGETASFEALRSRLGEARLPAPYNAEFPELAEVEAELAYEAFVLAQRLPVDLALFEKKEHVQRWLAEVESFNHLERRWLLHLAYERQHRREVLDGMIAQGETLRKSPAVVEPLFQACFCIDDREESTRRHLEECFPSVDTYGYAGFYGVAMNYQGVDDVRPRPLCPVSVRPKHLIVEQIVDRSQEREYRKKRRRHGVFTNSLSVASTTLTRGSLIALAFGAWSLVPLVFRSLFPRIAVWWEHTFEEAVAHTPLTRLALERTETTTDPVQRGYLVSEMVDIVESALKTMGLTEGFCDIALMVGHGSSSLNNPHEAAHDCGATGGGHGGSNARAFSMMANHPKVREALRQRGLDIPDRCWFVGAFHNTCDDDMTYYDEDLIPDRCLDVYKSVKLALAEACRRDAHERCRRFGTAPKQMSLDTAMAYAETHAADLAEPRPEYGHATNAVCIIGRRERTRGLFLDRRAFLVSYDPTGDPDGSLLVPLLLSMGPVGAGINLEYYFSFVDPAGYGSGTKLPHNITGLIGVMDGHATDLRTGLPWQMVEIHEPVRLVTIVEAKLDVIRAGLKEPVLKRLVGNGWIQFIAWDPDEDTMHVFRDGEFHLYSPDSRSISRVDSSAAHYATQRHNLPPVSVREGTAKMSLLGSQLEVNSGRVHDRSLLGSSAAQITADVEHPHNLPGSTGAVQ